MGLGIKFCWRERLARAVQKQKFRTDLNTHLKKTGL